MRKVLVAAVVIAAIAVAAAYFMVSPARGGRTVVIKDPKQVPKYAIAFVRNPYKDDYDISRIAGYVENRSAAKIVKASLDIQLTDSSGNRKELVKYDITEVLPYSRKSFDANAGSLPGTRRSTAKITQVEVIK